MTEHIEDRVRHIIPRWRSAATTLQQGELAQTRKNIPRNPPDLRDLHEHFEVWRHTKTPTAAGELLASAIVANSYDNAYEAADFIIREHRSTFPLLFDLAKRVVGVVPSGRATETADLLDTQHIQTAIRLTRQRLRQEPRNAVLWVEQSRNFEILGNQDRAERCMLAALHSARQNRFVLRCAARMYIHQDRSRAAYELLRRSDRVRHDPWLLAAMVAVASASGCPQLHVKQARNVVTSQRFAATHVSELASALATLEFESGNMKRGRSLLRLSITNPTENTIAQAAWVSRALGIHELKESEILRSKSPEAKAWALYNENEWIGAFQEARMWLSDQPFSSRPAILASYVASVHMNEPNRGARICEWGLHANPKNFTLLNNYAVCLARVSRIEAAERVFERIESRSLSVLDNIVWLATRGLIAFRKGAIATGREYYSQAMQAAAAARSTRLLARAAVFYAEEESVARAADYRQRVMEALHLWEELGAKELDTIVQRIRSLDERN